MKASFATLVLAFAAATVAGPTQKRSDPMVEVVLSSGSAAEFFPIDQLGEGQSVLAGVNNNLQFAEDITAAAIQSVDPEGEEIQCAFIDGDIVIGGPSFSAAGVSEPTEFAAPQDLSAFVIVCSN